MSYRDDLDAAHARIRALEQDLAGRENTPKPPKPKKEKPMRCPQCKGRFHRIGWMVFAAVAGLTLVSALLWLPYKAITEHGDRGCYVEGNGLTFLLMREVSWGGDRTIGEYRSLQEALDDAAKIGCKVGEVK